MNENTTKDSSNECLTGKEPVPAPHHYRSAIDPTLTQIIRSPMVFYVGPQMELNRAAGRLAIGSSISSLRYATCRLSTIRSMMPVDNTL